MLTGFSQIYFHPLDFKFFFQILKFTQYTAWEPVKVEDYCWNGYGECNIKSMKQELVGNVDYEDQGG